MTADLVVVDDDGLSQAEIDLIKQDICKGATNAELALFIRVCNRTHLDPFARQIYSVKRREKVGGNWVERHQTQVSIDGARLVAQRSGEYEGQEDTVWTADGVQWVDVWLENFPPKAARVGVYRSGFRQPLRAVAVWDQYAQTFVRDGKTQLGTMWAKMGSLMLGKCAEMLALRKAFPMELSGLYSAEEMSQAANDEPPLPPPTTRRAPPRRRPPELIDGQIVGDNPSRPDSDFSDEGAIDVPSEPATGAQEPVLKDPAEMDLRELTEALEAAGLALTGTKTQKQLRLVEYRQGVAPAQLDPEKISGVQLGQLANLFSEVSRERKLDICEEILGHKVETTRSLTRTEAQLVIDTMAAQVFEGEPS